MQKKKAVGQSFKPALLPFASFLVGKGEVMDNVLLDLG